MCGTCENDDNDPTPNELRDLIVHHGNELEQVTLFFEEVAASTPVLLKELPAYTEALRRRIGHLRADLAFALKHAIHADDDDWLRRAHKAEIYAFYHAKEAA
jgi:hypothetical protein